MEFNNQYHITQGGYKQQKKNTLRTLNNLRDAIYEIFTVSERQSKKKKKNQLIQNHVFKVSCEVRNAPLAEECLRRGHFWGCVCRGRCPSDTPLAALPANDGAAEGSVARSRDEYYDHSARNLRALWNVQREFLEFFLNGFEFSAFYWSWKRFIRALAEVVVCAVGWDVTLPVMEMTAQATPLPVLVTLFPSWNAL